MPGDPDLGNGDPDWQAQKLLILLPLLPAPYFQFLCRSLHLMVSTLLPESRTHGD